MMYDLGIIGAGPAGYVAAERAGQKGLKTVLFDKEYIGGVCLNVGCIPTKTLLHTAKQYSEAQNGKRYGLSVDNVSYDLPRVMKRKEKIVKKLVGGIKAQLKQGHVEVVMDEASIKSYSEEKIVISANETEYQCKNILIATGSEPIIPPIPGLKREAIYTNKEILEISEIPESLAIVGGGVIGMEFADFFNAMGSKVTVIEMLDEIISGADKQIAGMLRSQLTKRGIDIKLGAKVTSIESNTLTYQEGEASNTISADAILLSVGRKPVTNISGIEQLGLHFNKSGIAIDEFGQTNRSNVYAAGDITGHSMFAHTASREGEVVVNHILGEEESMNYNAVPAVVYTHPEVSGVGVTEEEAAQQNIDYQVHSLSMSFAGRFVIESERINGLCKIITAGKSQKIIGVHILGDPSSELIFGGVLAIEQGMTLQDFRKSIFPHPSVSEILKETSFIDADD